MRLTNQELEYLIDVLGARAKKDPSPTVDSLLLKFTDMLAFRSRKYLTEDGRIKRDGYEASGAAKNSEEHWRKIRQMYRDRKAVEPEFGVDEFHPLFKNGEPNVTRHDV